MPSIRKYYVYGKNNLFLHYDTYNNEYFFEGGFENASKWYNKKAAANFHKDVISKCRDYKGGKWFLITTTVTHSAVEDNSIEKGE